MNDHSAADPLEISSDVAEKAEEILREFAEDAELDVALIVDRSGALLAGIAADSEVSVETVGALVAGAAGAVRALGDSVGESEPVESIHQGKDQVVYLRELGEIFILVGVAESELPAGIVREKAAQVTEPLLTVLSGHRDDSETETVPEAEPEAEEPEIGTEPEAEEELEPITSGLLPPPPLPVFEDDLEPASDPEIESEIQSEEEEEDSDPVSFELSDTAPVEAAPEDDEFSKSSVETESDTETADSPPVVDSPFEIASEDEELDDTESETPTPVFELTGDDAPDLSELDDEEVEADEEESSVSAPLMVEPAISNETESEEDEKEEDVAAISGQIASDIGPVSAETGEPHADDENVSGEKEEDEEEQVGGPRYVFEIG
ncbi:MAG: hypothetical protein HKN23_07315 [Verrucomicrobiales bacterium]|nr:hypothetical protein [Verrucomicrobiales bacterium]